MTEENLMEEAFAASEENDLMPLNLGDLSEEDMNAIMQMFEASQLNLIEAEPMSDLMGILALLDDEELRYAIDMHIMPPEEFDTDAASGDELIAEAFRRLTQPRVHERTMFDMGPGMRETYLKIMETGRFEYEEGESEPTEERSLLDAIAVMLVAFPFLHDGKITYIIPDEIRATLQTVIDDGFLEFAAQNDLVYEYIDAATNLYGVIKLDDLAQIIESQNPGAFEEAPIQEFLHNVADYAQLWAYFEEDGVIAHEIFSNEGGLGKNYALELMQFASKLPRFVPEKEELLKYVDPQYYEENFEADLLAELIDGFFPNEKVGTRECVLFVQECARQGMRPEILIETLFEEYLPGPFANEAQANLAIKQIVKLVNTTRAWADNGRTLAEAEMILKH